jgi:acetolactate synthase-1/3 small subunit
MKESDVVIELTVRNHPGVMSHITGLFARRAFNLEGILCGEVGDGNISKIYLLVANNELLEQIVKQVKKLYDVLELNVHAEYNEEIFAKLDENIFSN